MPAIATLRGSTITTAAINTAVIALAAPSEARLEAIGILADAGDDQPSTADALHDRDRVQHEHAHPGEHGEETQHASERQHRHADDARDKEDRDPEDELHDHQDDAVLRMPLHL